MGKAELLETERVITGFANETEEEEYRSRRIDASSDKREDEPWERGNVFES